MFHLYNRWKHQKTSGFQGLKKWSICLKYVSETYWLDIRNSMWSCPKLNGKVAKMEHRTLLSIKLPKSNEKGWSKNIWECGKYLIGETGDISISIVQRSIAHIKIKMLPTFTYSLNEMFCCTIPVQRGNGQRSSWSKEHL